MDIFTKAFSPPLELTTKTFCVFPTNQDYTDSDYDAVMANKELLRKWSQSTWPEDDFTREQNREDLALHIQDNQDHSAYGYMIYSLDKKTCYGSVYVNPILTIPNHYIMTDQEIDFLKTHDARIDCWIIDDSSDLEKIIVSELDKWLRQTWKIRPLFSARKELTKRIGIYQELGFKKNFDLKSLTSEMTLLLF